MMDPQFFFWTAFFTISAAVLVVVYVWDHEDAPPFGQEPD